MPAPARPLFGILRSRIHTYRWAGLLIWLYAMEGMARVYTDRPPSAWLASAALVLALSLFVSAALYTRWKPRAGV